MKRATKRSPAPNFDDVKKAEFLRLLREKRCSRMAAADGVGTSRITVWRHMDADPDFRRRVSEAEMDVEREKILEVEDALFQAAINGHVTAQQVFLYNRAPERWKDKRAVAVGMHMQADEAARILSGMLGVPATALLEGSVH